MEKENDILVKKVESRKESISCSSVTAEENVLKIEKAETFKRKGLKYIGIYFFKHYGHKYMKMFVEHVNKIHIESIDDIILFKKLDNKFYKEMLKESSRDLNLTDVSLLEIFNIHSEMKLSNLVLLFKLDRIKFEKMLYNLDETLSFIILSPIKDVFNRFKKRQCEFDKVKSYILNKIKDEWKKDEELKVNETIMQLMDSFINNLS